MNQEENLAAIKSIFDVTAVDIDGVTCKLSKY